MLTYLFSGMAFGFSAASTPGPLSMYIASQAVSHGWRRTLPTAFSPLITDGPVAVLVLIILSQAPYALMPYLRLMGGLFLLYLAFGSWKSWRNFDAENLISSRGGAEKLSQSNNPLIKAAIINWLNPNPYLSWSTFLGPMILSAWRQSPTNGVLLILGFYITMISVMVCMTLAFSAAGSMGPHIRKRLMGTASLILAGLGIYQLWLGSISLYQAGFKLPH